MENRFKTLKNPNITNTFLTKHKERYREPFKNKFNKKEQFKLNEGDFPDLPLNNDLNDPNQDQYKIQTYLEKTNKEKTNEEKTNDINKIELPKKGWTTIKLDNTNKIIMTTTRTIFQNDIDNYLNKVEYRKKRNISNWIFNERIKHREELNNILGDISPYWNKNYILKDDDWDNNSDYENYYSSDSEFEYYDD